MNLTSLDGPVVVGTLLILAALIWLGVPLTLAGWWFLDRHHEQAWEADRPADYYDMPREDEPTTAEWVALLAAVDGPAIPAPRRPADLSAGVRWARESTPLHDRIVCEFIEREEGWA